MYVPLYIKTNYSLLSSVIRIDNLIERAKQNHFSSLAITDNNMYGTMEFYQKCKAAGIHPIIGLELELENDIILLYAKNYQGYQTLIKLSTIQSERKVLMEDIENHHDEVIAIVPFDSHNSFDKVQKVVKESDCFLGYKDKQQEVEARKKTSQLVYLNKTLYLDPEENEYLKYLYMIRDGKTIADFMDYDLLNHELRFEEVYEYSTNQGLFQTEQIAKACNLEFPKSELLLPIFETGKDLTSDQYLANLAKVGLITDASLKNFFKYAVVIIFVIAAIITPPDVLSQVFLAIPLIGLYGLSIIIARFVNPAPKDIDDDTPNTNQSNISPSAQNT